MKVNSINKLIISSTPIKRPRNINYKSNLNSSFVINYEFNLIILKINSQIFNYENFRLRKKRKLNLEIITYYYRYLDYFKDIT